MTEEENKLTEKEVLVQILCDGREIGIIKDMHGDMDSGRILFTATINDSDVIATLLDQLPLRETEGWLKDGLIIRGFLDVARNTPAAELIVEEVVEDAGEPTVEDTVED